MIIECPACLWLREHTVGPTKLRGTSSFGISEVTLRMSLVPMSGVHLLGFSAATRSRLASRWVTRWQ